MIGLQTLCPTMFRIDIHDKHKIANYPIDQYQKHILYLLERHQVLIVVGETGSGKSSRIPQFLFNSGCYNGSDDTTSSSQRRQLICVTQPRRVAAIQLAQRVADELKCQLGSTVGYAVRFKDVTNEEQTMIKYMTEGLLVREMMTDPLLDKYSVIIIDEVHERNLNTDLLLGLLKCILLQRNDLKLILCSASMNVQEFKKFFTYPNRIISETDNLNLREPSIIWAQGKTYPLKIYYKNDAVANYLDAAVDTAIDIHETSRLSSGKILIFLTGQDEVEYVCERLNDYSRTLSSRLELKQLLILPLHASLKSEDISKVFEEHGRDTRVCIVSTNVAETSLTIDGIAFVIDPGFAKLKFFDHQTGIDTLVKVPISKSSSKQRAGRAGRTREGVVYRLYPESQYEKLEDNTTPEIQRSSLTEVIMLLKSLGVDNIQRFPLISPMPRSNLISSLELLYALQAIDDSGQLNSTGELMAKLNLDPKVAKFLVSLESSGCTKEACTIAGVLQVKDIYAKPGRHASSLWSNTQLTNMCASEGDIISYLNIINNFIKNQKSQKWAERRSLNHQTLVNAVEISSRLESQLKKYGISITSSSGRTEVIQRSILSGLFSNVAYLHPSGCYKTIRGEQVVHIHPTSIFSEMTEQPKLVVFHEIINTTKPFMRHIMSIEQSWLLDVAPHYYKFATSLEMMRDR